MQSAVSQEVRSLMPADWPHVQLHGGRFESWLNRQLATLAPICFPPTTHPDVARDEKLAGRFLAPVFDAFLCNGNKPDTFYKQLAEQGAPSQFCGHVFKPGELTFSCRECASDPTCVLCASCFHQSTHRTHKYVMHSSGGSGYCDCGDVEAWKRDPSCSRHAKVDRAEQQNAIDNLPSDVRERAELLFDCLIEYVIETLFWETGAKEPRCVTAFSEVHETRIAAAHVSASSSNNSATSASTVSFGNLARKRSASTNPADADPLTKAAALETMSLDSLMQMVVDRHVAAPYCTVLFNDEIHTYDIVTQALTKALGSVCDDQMATYFASVVDRDGRSTVKLATLSECENSTRIITNHTSKVTVSNKQTPVKTLTMRSVMESHQRCAVYVLTWIRETVARCVGLRQLFSVRALDTRCNTQPSLIEVLITRDSDLWKVARHASHELIMRTVLMDTDSKRCFAILYTNCYRAIMARYVEDSHRHADCVLSLTVQVYTVISIARTLIAEHSLIQKLLQTFMEHCNDKIDKIAMKFRFDAPERTDKFKPHHRATHALRDLSYALAIVPTAEVWSSPEGDHLRRGFQHGFREFIRVLRYMHGIDTFGRQTNVHIEYEQEWEATFNLQLRLDELITLFISWAGSDRASLIAAYKMVLDALRDERAAQPYRYQMVNIGSMTTQCIDFQVDSEKMSLHMPLNRMLAALYVYFETHGVSFCSLELAEDQAQFRLEELMEPALRVQVLMAQVNAGIWRRNGMSLVHQLACYQHVSCRHNMYDMDIRILQIVASLKEPNEFLTHLLNRFKLLDWLNQCESTTRSDEAVKQAAVIVEFFLNLLIIIVNERLSLSSLASFTDATYAAKYELLHVLCLASQPLTHSEIVQQLPDQLARDDRIEAMLHEIAETKRQPTGDVVKVVYEPKSNAYLFYNPHFYHYSRAEKVKSAELQRKRRKAAASSVVASDSQQANIDALYPEALPPACNVAFSPAYANILNLLHCDLMQRIFANVLSEMESNVTAALHVRRLGSQFGQLGSLRLRYPGTTDTHLEQVLFLIGIALHADRHAHENGTSSFLFLEKSLLEPFQILEKLETVARKATELLRAVNVSAESPADDSTANIALNHVASSLIHDAQLQLLNWTIRYFKRILRMRNEALNIGGPQVEACGTGAGGAVSMVVDSDLPPSTVALCSAEKKRKVTNDRATRCRDAVMAKMSEMQKQFIVKNQELFTQGPGPCQNTLHNKLREKCSDYEKKLGHLIISRPHAVGRQRVPPTSELESYTCMLCQEEQQINVTYSQTDSNAQQTPQRAMVFAAFVQRTNVLRTLGFDFAQLEANRAARFASDRLINTCGHAMHADCFKRFFEQVVAKERQRFHLLRYNTSYDIERHEYLCPLCESLCNTTLPIVPCVAALCPESTMSTRSCEELKFAEWLVAVGASLRNSVTVASAAARPANAAASKCPNEADKLVYYLPTMQCVRDATDHELAAKYERLFVTHAYGDSAANRSRALCLSEELKQTLSKFGNDLELISAIHEVDRTDANEPQAGADESVPRAADWDASAVGLPIWHSFVYFTKLIETVCRTERISLLPLLKQMPTRSVKCGQAVCRAACVYPQAVEPDVARKHCVELLAALFSNVDDSELMARLKGQPIPTPNDQQRTLRAGPILTELDVTSVVCQLFFAMPLLYARDSPLPAHLVPSCYENENYLILFGVLIELVKNIVSLRLDASGCEQLAEMARNADKAHSVVDASREDACYISEHVIRWHRCARGGDNDPDLDVDAVTRHAASIVYALRLSLVPYLRSIAVLLVCYSQHEPEKIEASATQTSEADAALCAPDEFAQLCQYLALPFQISCILKFLDCCPIVCNRISYRLSDPRLHAALRLPNEAAAAHRQVIAKLCVPRVLIDLPHDYSDVVRVISAHPCPSGDEASRSPVLCLICGRVCCTHTNYNCQHSIMVTQKEPVGDATWHAVTCHANLGIFLRIRECQILYLADVTKGSFAAAPYYDAYGEPDTDLRRGNPLFFCEQAYTKLKRFWLKHCIREEVSRALESSSQLKVMDWQRF